MPNYDFVCENCGHKETLLLNISDRNGVRICPNCLCVLTRLIGSSAGFIFKGKGCYATDYQKPRDIKRQAIKEKKRRKEGKSGYTEV